MPRYFINTLGCKVNRFESDAVGMALTSRGWQETKQPADADVCIINTCTVTGKASVESRHHIRQTIRKNPSAKMVVTGCYAQTEAEEIEKIEGVDAVISHTEKHRLPELVIALHEKGEAHFSEDRNKSCRETEFKGIDVDALGTRTRPLLKVQDGCNAFCSYCIVPHTRGRSRSMPMAEALARLASLGARGFQEVVLTGIHIGCYGLDLTPATSFYALLKQMEEEKPVKRIRLSSMEPMEITDEVIDLITGSSFFCDHVHIPLQSGDDTVLSRMKRPYTTARFKELVTRIHDLSPETAIGADVIIGFPGETEKQFENTCAFLESLPLAYLHVFPFSPRERTPAASFDGRIDGETMKHRTARVRAIGDAAKKRFMEAALGTRADVLVERERDHHTGLLKGVTSQYIPVQFQGDDSLMNQLVPVTLESVSDAGYLTGRREES
ncbi:tRNA (N(6)-L-threonylcarbamoyladenosine(37)-C(2))-methylthiotransferase MtaB [Desulfoluna spongiiphila]|uniref:Threonylcarbamoyladenosine tRNA methylthiotransferase MtaB n=1 Tax=Desulfoluna spongiiphila TaxID=419481 RepID=A0A1G5IZF6_9BACT|nr:tRNA (N(6)-L-threonylcarbamoyladenosine(37)-C(2))-methylthiotransferase MtaB [Desulfoluna spongiiphila]SCY81493.1 threonylcarbamoyladenosine tRNA methylthiotransferase MtaB [Desulfoluna spongiiphila]